VKSLAGPAMSAHARGLPLFAPGAGILFALFMTLAVAGADKRRGPMPSSGAPCYKGKEAGAAGAAQGLPGRARARSVADFR
jgi:hypothetical protein